MNIHILRAPPTTTDKETAQLAALSKNEKRYLSKFCCGLCEMPLNRVCCGGIYETCDEQVRIDRRVSALEHYKPRKP